MIDISPPNQVKNQNGNQSKPPILGEFPQVTACDATFSCHAKLFVK